MRSTSTLDGTALQYRGVRPRRPPRSICRPVSSERMRPSRQRSCAAAGLAQAKSFAGPIRRVEKGVRPLVAASVALCAPVALGGCVVTGGSSSNTGGAGFLFVLLPVFMLFFIWRVIRPGGSRRRARRSVESQQSDAPNRHLLKAELSVLSDDVLRLEPQVVLKPEAQGDFDAALHRYRVATAALEQVEVPVDLVRVQRVVDEATWSMARARAILDDRPVPAPPVSLQRSGQRGEPAVDVDGDQPVYVGSRESFQSGWFGGGGMFGGLLMGSILGGFGGFVLDDLEPDGDESDWIE